MKQPLVAELVVAHVRHWSQCFLRFKQCLAAPPLSIYKLFTWMAICWL